MFVCVWICVVFEEKNTLKKVRGAETEHDKICDTNRKASSKSLERGTEDVLVSLTVTT